MLTTKYKALDRAQFKLLREAKLIIKQEFDFNLKLQEADVLDKLYEYAMESSGEELYEIFNEITRSMEPTSPAPVAQRSTKTSTKNAKVGDIINGKKVVSMYRGKPVFG